LCCMSNDVTVKHVMVAPYKATPGPGALLARKNIFSTYT